MFIPLSKETALAVRLIALAISLVLLLSAVASFIGLADTSAMLFAVLLITSFVVWLVAGVLGVLISEDYFVARSSNALPVLDFSRDDLTNSDLK